MDHVPFGRMRLMGQVASELAIIEPLPATPGDGQATARLTVTNTSQSPVDDTVTLTLDPAGIAEIVGDATIAVRLQPGETMSHDFAVSLLQKTMASGVYLVVPKSPRGQIVRVPSPLLPIADRPLPRLPETALAAVAEALKEQPVYPLEIDGKRIVDLRFAVAGTNLIVDAVVTDTNLKQGARPWKGSLFEIFAAAPNDQGGIHQIFLVPADAEAPARALIPSEGKQVAAPTIALQSQATATGYRLQAVVPLAMLGMAGPTGRVKLEFQVSTTLGDGKMHYGTVFESPRAYQDHSYYGRFEIRRD
jgi:hypothetical protein